MDRVPDGLGWWTVAFNLWEALVGFKQGDDMI